MLPWKVVRFRSDGSVISSDRGSKPRNIAFGDNSLVLRPESELSDLRTANANRFRGDGSVIVYQINRYGYRYRLCALPEPVLLYGDALNQKADLSVSFLI